MVGKLGGSFLFGSLAHTDSARPETRVRSLRGEREPRSGQGFFAEPTCSAATDVDGRLPSFMGELRGEAGTGFPKRAFELGDMTFALRAARARLLGGDVIEFSIFDYQLPLRLQMNFCNPESLVYWQLGRDKIDWTRGEACMSR
jgi:hypothetical protein